jgi:hypothetical protein
LRRKISVGEAHAKANNTILTARTITLAIPERRGTADIGMGLSDEFMELEGGIDGEVFINSSNLGATRSSSKCLQTRRMTISGL